jgi:hypothetical protein
MTSCAGPVTALSSPRKIGSAAPIEPTKFTCTIGPAIVRSQLTVPVLVRAVRCSLKTYGYTAVRFG